MRHAVCIHGHFYQPPRENPWLERVETQDSAYPYHDWNERITSECYAQNAASRILDDRGRIVAITNNYARISFNIGPTLLAWMESHDPETYAAILAADADSRRRFGGHGSAIAQAYNHLIMPLASPRDRRTQIAWGIADFRARFGRDPEGMWLPETAVDTDTLELLAEAGIRFTILEPSQAGRVRPVGDTAWEDVSGGRVDTTVAYRAALPSGRDLAVFFYDGGISRAVAFEGLLQDGARFAGRLVGALDRERPGPQLVNIATDGESYGHHHRHGDMALAVALEQLEADPDVELTNYGQFLELHPPTLEVEVVDETSWSCAHGIERWRSACGCSTGDHPDWPLAWRAPLRAALDWLRDELAPRYVDRARQLFTDPWAARDDYIAVILERTDTTREDFLARHARRPLTADERTTAWRLLEMQRHSLLMYTSCGWFFDDLSRIEARQVLVYAARALQLARAACAADLEPAFLDRLALARSHDPAFGDGRRIWEQHVRPKVVDLEQVAAHHALSVLFEEPGKVSRTYCYAIEREDERTTEAGAARLALGRIAITSLVTEESARFEYGTLHLGDHNLDGGVRPLGTDLDWVATTDSLLESFAVADLPETIRRLDDAFGPDRYALGSLFQDDQRRILRTILDSSVNEARAIYRTIHRERAPLMRYLHQLDVRIPTAFRRAAEVVVNDELRRAFEDPQFDVRRVRELLADAEAWKLELDTARLAFTLNATIERITRGIADLLPQPRLFDRFGPEEEAFLERSVAIVEFARSLPFEVDLWRAQNLLYGAVHGSGDLVGRAAEGDRTATAWLKEMRRLGEVLGVAVP